MLQRKSKVSRSERKERNFGALLLIATESYSGFADINYSAASMVRRAYMYTYMYTYRGESKHFFQGITNSEEGPNRLRANRRHLRLIPLPL